MFCYNWKAIAEGTASRVSLLVKPNDLAGYDDFARNIDYVCDRNTYRVVYAVGNTYAVQPARNKPAIWWVLNSFGKPSAYPDAIRSKANERYASAKGFRPLRIRITEIRREDVRQMYSEDWLAEGFLNKWEFLEVWTAMHDKELYKQFKPMLDADRDNDNIFAVADMFEEAMTSRPAELYDAWVIEFEIAA